MKRLRNSAMSMNKSVDKHKARRFDAHVCMWTNIRDSAKQMNFHLLVYYSLNIFTLLCLFSL